MPPPPCPRRSTACSRRAARRLSRWSASTTARPTPRRSSSPDSRAPTIGSGSCAARARFIEAPLVHPSTTFRRAALEAVGGWRDAGWAEDWDLLLRLAQAGWAMAKVPEVLLWWRDSGRRLTRTGDAYRPERMVRLR